MSGVNSCGIGAASTIPIIVNPLPLGAGTIFGEEIVCQGEESVGYNVPEVINSESYIWTLPYGGIGNSTTNEILVNYSLVSESGNIIVKGVNSCGEGDSSVLFIDVNPLPNTPNITLNDYILYSDFPYGNQWYNQDGIINEANNQEYVVTNDGDYYVIVTQQNCSSNPSNIISVIGTEIQNTVSNENISIYPIPFSDELTIQHNGNTSILYVEIINAIGQIVLSYNFINKGIVDTRSLEKGVYVIKFSCENILKYKTVLKK